jgi:rsbT co-antagonist protein RsbR
VPRTNNPADSFNVDAWAVLDALPGGLAALDAAGIIRYTNAAWQKVLSQNGLASEEMSVGKNFLAGYEAIFHPRDEDRAAIAEGLRAALSGTSERFDLDYIYRDSGERRWFTTTIAPYLDNGVRCAIVRQQDVTHRKEAEEALRASEAERARLQEEIIRSQAAALAELSTPLIPLSDHALIMPLIGVMDSRRAQEVMNTLLHGIAASNARLVVLDITGVSVVDTHVAGALIRAAQAVRLLGARIILTGIRPEVAQAVVGLGVDLSIIETRASLQDGIASALRPGAAR